MYIKNYLRRIIGFVLLIILIFETVCLNNNVAIYGGNDNDIGTIEISEDSVGSQYFEFKVSGTLSNAKYKYRTIGWRVQIQPNGTEFNV